MKIRKKQTLNHILLGFAVLVFLSSCNTDETQTVATFDNLVLEDNFDKDGEIDTSIWNFDIGDGTAEGIPGWGNNELQYYTDRTDNVTTENGFLLITAKQENFNGAQYTSARLQTKNKFQQLYGRFEARIRLPYGQGMWPAFWLLGDDSDGEVWPRIGEIDIMENVGNEPTRIFGTVHGPNFSGAESVSKAYTFDDTRVDTEFHVYGIEWGPNYINYYVDDVLYNQITPEDIEEETNGEGQWVFNDRPFYIILNVAVGGNLPGPPNAETVFPQTMLVDYVRVYQK
ncbi:MAG: glycoside hydrolase family 16 protein [Winogradskyella sp.]|uniref:glycoside hydrolase family 16 protein n=1 Tax=Winogradskyella sp. TaxID=1883156 RepID=UPI0017B9B62B|nr:glycoside hydrolase family 16 protein [Winogradskyella sp.]MBT8245046.1 glycoside hydrolase family 16 protein [Winogradskyella sp.]NNK22112.1 glycoside hydrolase family 16 protein [Winogradskyella sp.]